MREQVGISRARKADFVHFVSLVCLWHFFLERRVIRFLVWMMLVAKTILHHDDDKNERIGKRVVTALMKVSIMDYKRTFHGR